MKRWLIVVLCLMFGGPLFTCVAADKPQSGGPFEGGNVMSAREKSDCKLAIRLAARLQRLKGQITREQLQTVLSATDNKEAWAVVSDHVADMATEQTLQGTKAGPRAAGGWLQWILDNFPQILQMITQIVALFSDALPGDVPLYVDAMPEGLALCGGGGCPRIGCQCPSVQVTTVIPPATVNVETSVCVKGCQPAAKAPRVRWWQRGPVRRLVSAPVRLCR